MAEYKMIVRQLTGLREAADDALARRRAVIFSWRFTRSAKAGERWQGRAMASRRANRPSVKILTGRNHDGNGPATHRKRTGCAARRRLVISVPCQKPSAYRSTVLLWC